MAGISEVAAIADGNTYDSSINFRTKIDKKFRIPKEFQNEYVFDEDNETNKSSISIATKDHILEPNAFDKTELDPKFGVSKDQKIYSDGFKLTIADKDLDEYEAWVKDKTNRPSLLKNFDSEDDYKVFMENYKDTHLTLDIDPAVMKSRKTFSITNNESYQFKIDTDSWQGDEQFLDFDHVIGSVLFSITYSHLFHLCTTDYPAHIALNDYYEDMPEKVDALAEKYLSDNSSCMFANAIIPGLDPIDYFTRLKKFIVSFESKMGDVYDDAGAYQSEIDDIINLISSTLYKLKRLATPKMKFSIKD